MSFFKPKTVLNSLWPSLALIWVFGAGIGVKRVWRIPYAIIMTVIVVYVNTYPVTTELTLENRMISYFITFLKYLRIMGSLILIWLWVLKGVSAVENSILELTKLDEELRNFGLKENHRIFLWKQLVIIGGFIVMILSVCILQQSSVIDTYGSRMTSDGFLAYLLLTLSIHMQHFQSVIADVVFTMMLEAFRRRFKLVNDVFKGIAGSEDRMKVKVSYTSYSHVMDVSGSKFQERNAKKVSNSWKLRIICIAMSELVNKAFCVLNILNNHTLQKIILACGLKHLSSHLVMERVDRACRIHRRLLKVAQDVGDAFSLHLCVNYSTSLPYIVMDAFTLVSFLTDTEAEISFADTNVLSAVLAISRFLQIVISCSNTIDEANKLGTSLYRVPIDDAEVHNQLQEHSIYIVQRKLRFTAGGIAEINRNWAKSVFSTVVKYMIVLLQLHKND